MNDFLSLLPILHFTKNKTIHTFCYNSVLCELFKKNVLFLFVSNRIAIFEYMNK